MRFIFERISSNRKVGFVCDVFILGYCRVVVVSLSFVSRFIIENYRSTVKGFTLNEFKNCPVVYVFK